MKQRALFTYRFLSLAMAAVFAVVGLLFLVLPGQVLEFFNRLSASLGLAPAPLRPGSFYPVLAVAYMYLVTLLAWLMARRPGDPLLPLLLAHGKFASAVLSLVFFFGRAPYLVCLANAVVDAGIGTLALWLRRLQKRHSASWPT
jgi:hypothetical protein